MINLKKDDLKKCKVYFNFFENEKQKATCYKFLAQNELLKLSIDNFENLLKKLSIDFEKTLQEKTIKNN